MALMNYFFNHVLLIFNITVTFQSDDNDVHFVLDQHA
jgi:hypothetical protein